MKNIEVKILNPFAIIDAEKMLATTSRITQRGEKIANTEDFLKVHNMPYDMNWLERMCNLPHPTIQKFGLINVAVVGASRRFLAQITRHQNEIKFMSGSLQYSDYSKDNNKTSFVVPYNYYDTDLEEVYLKFCEENYKVYSELVAKGKEEELSDAGDAAGFAMGQGLRNILIMSATPFQWKYMIGLRTCNRNTKEMQYVMLKIWEQLYNISPALFGHIKYGCLDGACPEGSFCCASKSNDTPLGKDAKPSDILAARYPKIYKPADKEWTREAMKDYVLSEIDKHFERLAEYESGEAKK